MGLRQAACRPSHEKASYDVDDFEVPTGREEEWRFTPLAACAACTTARPRSPTAGARRPGHTPEG